MAKRKAVIVTQKRGRDRVWSEYRDATTGYLLGWNACPMPLDMAEEELLGYVRYLERDMGYRVVHSGGSNRPKRAR